MGNQPAPAWGQVEANPASGQPYSSEAPKNDTETGMFRSEPFEQVTANEDYIKQICIDRQLGR